MPLCSAAAVHVSAKHRQVLEAVERRRNAPQGLVRRAQIILLAARGVGVRATAERLGIARATVQRWRRRWSIASATESALERLVDAPRPATPATFSPEQICSILALACEPPKRDGRELTHWTHADLAAEVVARGIFESISPDSIGRFLREADLKPHRVRGWDRHAARCAVRREVPRCMRVLSVGARARRGRHRDAQHRRDDRRTGA